MFFQRPRMAHLSVGGSAMVGSPGVIKFSAPGFGAIPTNSLDVRRRVRPGRGRSARRPSHDNQLAPRVP
jgi:hypothetical protein